MYRAHVMICGGTGCTASGSQKLQEALAEELKKKGLEDEIKIVQTGCFGLCELGPIMVIYPGDVFYSRVTVDDIPEIVEEHLLKGRIVERLVHEDEVTQEKTTSLDDTSFYKIQQRVALRNCGVIDPENIDEYLAMDGYTALQKVLTTMTPDDVIQTLLDSGLRGRGGAGFPTGLKWKFAKQAQNDVKYVCCNADEGDPGAFMDRSVLEGDPHSVLEAMAIAGYTIGSHQGYVYVRAEYPIAVKRLNIALKQARDYGLIGKNIMGTGFDFDIDIRLGAGAFVCGEETALMTSIEGKRGEPRPRPPFPANKGLFQKPSILNNVETWANIPQIINNGPEWFASIGTEKSKGTKVFALGGKIKHTGLVEVPMGTTLRQIVEEVGGGIPNGKKFKAAQTGGPSGGCIPKEHFDVPMDYEHLAEIGSIMGSGGLIVMDEDNCAVDVAHFYMSFICDESCGKCSPCRIGTKRLYEMLTDVTQGKGTEKTLDDMKELATVIKQGSLCALGQTAANPILSTMNNFPEEYRAHVVDKKCPAHVCKKLMAYIIDPAKCVGCTLCARNCPVSCIKPTDIPAKPMIPGKPMPGKFAHAIDQSKCIKCGSCLSGCRFGAIEKK